MKSNVFLFSFNLFRMIKIVNIIKWLCILLGLIGTVVGVYCLQLKHKSDQMNVSKVAVGQISGKTLNNNLNGVTKGA